MTFCCCFLCCGSEYFVVYTINGRICRLPFANQREREMLFLFHQRLLFLLYPSKVETETERDVIPFLPKLNLSRERERERMLDVISFLPE